jgi:hypothetical protein
MITKRLLLSSVSLILAGTLAFPADASASSILLDTGTGNGATVLAADIGIAQRIDVATATQLTAFGFYFNMPLGGDAKFMIWDGTNTALLYSDVVTVSPSGTLSLMVHTLAAPFALNAGSSYYFGVIGDAGWRLEFIFPTISLTTNGLTLSNVGDSNYQNFSSPFLLRNAFADVSLQLQGTQDVSPVPEPASLTFLGLGLAGMATRRWRHRTP